MKKNLRNITATQRKGTFKDLLLAVCISVLLLVGIITGFGAISKKANAACPANPTTYGVVTGTFNVAQTGTYRVWSRIQPDSTTNSNNSFILEIDDTTCGIVVGDATIPASTWTWVDYRDGNTTSKINQSLTAGVHTYKIYGREDGVQVDNVVFSADPACVPTGTGSNCSTTTFGSGNTCGTKQGDANKDNSVNILDISAILSAYGQTSTTSCTDVTKDGSINIQDISLVLSKYGT